MSDTTHSIFKNRNMKKLLSDTQQLAAEISVLDTHLLTTGRGIIILISAPITINGSQNEVFRMTRIRMMEPFIGCGRKLNMILLCRNFMNSS